VTKTKHILSVCADLDLGAARALLLRDSGLEVATAASQTEAEKAIAGGEFDALLVGHTVASEVATAVTEAFRRVNPKALVVFVASGWFIPIRADRVVQVNDGPHVLLAALGRSEP
jgi:DNA-binding NtrC family response regulator